MKKQHKFIMGQEVRLKLSPPNDRAIVNYQSDKTGRVFIANNFKPYNGTIKEKLVEPEDYDAIFSEKQPSWCYKKWIAFKLWLRDSGLIDLLKSLSPLIVLLAIFTSVFIGSSVMESRTYNRLTGSSTTWWDAMWVQLRVSDNPKD